MTVLYLAKVQLVREPAQALQCTFAEIARAWRAKTTAPLPQGDGIASMFLEVYGMFACLHRCKSSKCQCTAISILGGIPGCLTLETMTDTPLTVLCAPHATTTSMQR